jgi:hypothetical protein
LILFVNLIIYCFSYYGINVFSSKSDHAKLDSNKSLGRLIIFLGLCLVIISGVDISKVSATIPDSDQSIWPSSGKGIWIGLFVICVGVFTLIAVKEQSHSAFYVLLLYTIIAIILCFFGFLTSISVLERYTEDPSLSNKTNRTKEQTIEFTLAGLLIGIFGLSFLFLSCLSCMICWTIPNFCTKVQETNPQLFYRSQQSGLIQDFPLRSPANSHRSIIRQSLHLRYQRPYRQDRFYKFSRHFYILRKFFHFQIRNYLSKLNIDFIRPYPLIIIFFFI